MNVIIRPETPADISAIDQVNQRAFNRENEARLVDNLRNHGAVILSLVAEMDDRIIGHILFSPVTITHADCDWQAVGLAPMAVLPEFQNRGIGSALIRAGLADLKQRGHAVVIVLGHPEYYPRFGFRPAQPLGIRWERDVPTDVFMLTELTPDALQGRRGVVRYHPAFEDV